MLRSDVSFSVQFIGVLAVSPGRVAIANGARTIETEVTSDDRQKSTGRLRAEVSAAHRVGLSVASAIEERYWLPIRTGSLVERFVDDPALGRDPGSHPGLFSDHGVTHVRDIAELVLDLAQRNDGVLVAPRSQERASFVSRVAVSLTYLHDIGMAAPTRESRRVHPQFAAQVALSREFDPFIDEMWRTDPLIRARLEQVHEIVGSPAEPLVMLREICAMSVAHSKSAIPASVLDDRSLLRSFLLCATFIPLGHQLLPLSEHVRQPFAGRQLCDAATRYTDVTVEAFAWLVHPAPLAQQLADDVIDAARLLRAGDALRQRGVSLRTSGGYEICVNPNNGCAVYGLRSIDGGYASLLEVDNPISAAESNFAFAMIGPAGELRLGFNRSFDNPDVRAQIVASTADLVADIEADALGSFAFGASGSPEVQLIAVPGDQGFTDEIAIAVAQRHRHLRGRVRSTHEVSLSEDCDLDGIVGRRSLLTDVAIGNLFARMGERGLRVDAVDTSAAARDLRVVSLPAGATVLQAGTKSTFVVVPLGVGLRVHPSSGYESQPLHPWLPVGATGVVCGGVRNAAVVAETDVDIAVIPADTYLRHWFRPYSVSEIAHVVRGWSAEFNEPSTTDQP